MPAIAAAFDLIVFELGVKIGVRETFNADDFCHESFLAKTGHSSGPVALGEHCLLLTRRNHYCNAQLQLATMS